MAKDRQLNGSRRVISDIPGIRASLTEVVLLTLAVAFGVNLVSTVLSSWMPQWLTLTIGAVLGLVPIIYVAWNRLKAVVYETQIEGFLVLDKEANELLEVPEYDLADDAVRYLSAAFAENPALRRQWDEEPLMNNWHKSANRGGLGDRLVNELVEYIVLDRLSMTLSAHFNSTGFSEDKLRTYRRADLPDILLKNRFLELFSRDIADRDGFEHAGEPSGEGWTLVATSSSAGAYYQRFELILPSDSTIKRTEDNDLLIEGPTLTARISASVPGYGGKAPSALRRLYLGHSGWDSHDLSVQIDVQVKIKRQLFLRREALRYSVWIEDVLEDLAESFSGDRFVSRIQWPLLEAAVQVFDRDARGHHIRSTAKSPKTESSK
ncbi:hypothetical protein [Cryobacterium sp. Y82]|uniref:hypothetical protein n=1 Tax=Cryobacterium sp. Y82 TaxID=2045017 RepID=UPI0011B019EC|nr:hypothetical protein [Cryobacterium sp. Y82]